MEENFDVDRELIQVISKLERYSYSYQLSEDDRKDLLSETILKILTNKNHFVVKNNAAKDFINWCSRIMINCFINNYRRQKLISMNSIDEIKNSGSLLIFNNSELFSIDLFQYVFDRISNEKDKIIFKAYLQGYQYDEIAEILEMPIGTIKSRLHIIKKNLRKHLINENCKINCNERT